MAAEFTVWEVNTDAETEAMPWEGLEDAKIVFDVRHPIEFYDYYKSLNPLRKDEDYHEIYDFNRLEELYPDLNGRRPLPGKKWVCNIT